MLHILPASVSGDHHHPPALLPGAVRDSQAVSLVPLAPGAGVVLSLPGQALAVLSVTVVVPGVPARAVMQNPLPPSQPAEKEAARP